MGDLTNANCIKRRGFLVFKDMSLARNAEKHEKIKMITRYYKCLEKRLIRDDMCLIFEDITGIC